MGSPEAFSGDGALYYATDYSQLYIFGLRQPEKLRLCMITLDTEIELGPKVIPAALSSPDYYGDLFTDDTTIYVAFGFGSHEQKWDMPISDLMALEMKSMLNEELCIKAYGHLMNDMPGRLDHFNCLLHSDKDMGSLNIADTGAPVFGRDDYLLHGIVLAHITDYPSPGRPAVVVPLVPAMRREIFGIMKKTNEKLSLKSN